MESKHIVKAKWHRDCKLKKVALVTEKDSNNKSHNLKTALKVRQKRKSQEILNNNFHTELRKVKPSNS